MTFSGWFGIIRVSERATWLSLLNRNLSEVFGIKTTISDLICQAQKVSSPVFGIDFSKLSKKILFNSEENDIHKLSRYVKEIQPDERLPLDSILNYNTTFEISRSHFNPTLRPFVRAYLLDFAFFDFENSSFPELSYFVEVLFDVMMYFRSTPCFQTSLPGYIYLLAKGILPYEEDCFHNFFLVDFSESPFTVESIKHFRLVINNGCVRFIFKDYDMSLSDTFELLVNKKEFTDFLQQYHSINKIHRTNKAISSVLSNL